jgi:hypothetical protein
MKKAMDDLIRSLRETIALSIEAHEMIIQDLTKASKYTKKIQKENQKLKNQIVVLENKISLELGKESNEKINGN